MRKLLSQIDRWHAQGKAVALATVVKVYGSAPQPLGAKMAISDAGEMAGSVSGGCVEGAVVQEALAVLASGAPRLVEYGIADELAVSVGLACGGIIEVWIEPLRPTLFVEAVRAARLAAQVTVLKGSNCGAGMAILGDGTVAGSLGDGRLDGEARAVALQAMASQRVERLTAAAEHDTVELFVDVEAPPPTLIVVGAVHIAIPLVSTQWFWMHGAPLPPRSALAMPTTCAPAGRPTCCRSWSSTKRPVLSFSPTAPSSTIRRWSLLAQSGPLHRRPWLAARPRRGVARLQEAGLADAEVGRIRAPIGLDIGARRPEEIAIAIMAEIVAAVNGKRTWLFDTRSKPSAGAEPCRDAGCDRSRQARRLQRRPILLVQFGTKNDGG